MIDYLHAERSSIKRNPITKEYTLGISGKGGRTYAIEKINIRSFLVGETVLLNFGTAKCNEEDTYNKKLGRELAVSRMKPIEFKVNRIVYTKGRVDLSLENDEFEVDLSFMEKKRYSRLEHATYNGDY
jgi:hypothetical protein